MTAAAPESRSKSEPAPNVTGDYLPAAGRRGFESLYDPVVGATMRERTFRALLVEHVRAAQPAAQRVLDLGTGTGSLALALARALAQTRITGLDPDPGILARARAKAAQAGLEGKLDWVQGRSEQLPFEDGTFQAVSCSLMLHHLEPPAKLLALGEALRVLAPGGTLHIADWGAAQDPVMRLAFFAIQLLDGFSRTRDHAAGLLPDTIARAGFEQVQVRERLRTVWGTLELIDARRA
ncbi:MAG TPA: class I SAM-dependent methyltransferase [Solirubrobacteraceae bacterium]|nr:class I SAM-dependent methyltransferase [Solirubrobacteraceae bacterium]